MKDVQSTGEVFIPQKKTSSISKLNFFTFVDHFGPPGSGAS